MRAGLKIIVFISSFFLNIYLARYLSLDDFGLYIKIQLFLTFACTIFSLNIPENLTVLKTINFTNYRVIITTLLTLIFTTILYFITIIALILLNINFILDYYFIFYFLLTLSIIFIITQRISMYLAWYKFIILAELFNNSIWVILFLLNILQLSIYNILLSRIFSLFIYLLIFSYNYIKYTRTTTLPSINLKKTFISHSSKIIKFGIFSLSGSVSYLLLTMTDRFYVSFFLGDSFTSLLTIAFIPLSISVNFVNSILLVKYINTLFQTDSTIIKENLITTINSLLILSLFLIAIFSIYANEIILILGGVKYTSSITLLRLFSVSLIPLIVTPFLRQYMIMDSVKKVSILYTLILSLSIVLSYIFIPNFKNHGLIIIILISILINYSLLFILLKQVNLTKYYSKIIRYIVLSLIIIIISFFLSNNTFFVRVMFAAPFIGFYLFIFRNNFYYLLRMAK